MSIKLNFFKDFLLFVLVLRTFGDQANKLCLLRYDNNDMKVVLL